MSTYYAILTAVGEAKLANATALGAQLQLSAMAVGDGNGALPTPVRTQTALVRETYRAGLNNLSVDPLNASQIIAELVIPETEGGYWLREMGIYDAAGDLFAVANCPPSYKPQMAEGSGRTQVLRMVLIVSSTAAVQLRIDPSIVLATRAFAESLITVHVEAADPHKQYQLRGGFTSLNANTQLTAAHEGVVILDATAGDRTLTLPAATSEFGIRDLLIRRLDNSGNRARVQAAGTDKIKFHTHLRADGYGFLYLMGAGDWWHLRSDKAGSWWPIGRHDSDALGRPVFETTTMVAPGGWGVFAGSSFVRADWPWLWDHAQQSGMLTTEAARVGMEGGWTSADGAATFRGPDGRSEFMRVLDSGRGIDAGRVAGSLQSDALENVSGSILSRPFSGGAGAITGGSGPFWTSGSAGAPGASLIASAQGSGNLDVTTFDLSRVARTANETRSRNLAYPGRIKLI